MTGTETVPPTVTVEEYVARVEHPRRRREALQLLRMMREETGEDPVMCGPSTVGFGVRRCVHDAAHEGDAACVGFSPRKAHLVIHGLTSAPAAGPLLERLGRFRTGVAGLYIDRLADVDMVVLRALTRVGYGHMSSTSKGSPATRGTAG
jgi:hypothetical protein